MNTELREASASDYKLIKKLYKKAFPLNERAPFFLLRCRAQGGNAGMMVAFDRELFVGFVYVLEYLDVVYLFYLAIDEPVRGRGYGGSVIEKLKELYAGKRLFLAREQIDESADNKEQRINRRNFYMHHGFEDMDCRLKEATVIYDVMGIGGKVTPAEYDELITRWCGRFARRLVDMRLIEVNRREEPQWKKNV